MTLFSKLKQYQDLRNKAKELKNLMAEETMVIDNQGIKIIINGNQEILEIKIAEQYFNVAEKEKLEKNLVNNFNEAIRKVQRLMAEKIRSSGMELPKL